MTRGRRGQPASPSERAGYSYRRVFSVAILLFILTGELWSLATPLNGGPDERAQIIKAAAVVRGEWLGGRVPGKPAYTRVDVPESYADLGGGGGCFIEKPATPAGSCRPVGTSSRRVSTATYVGHYPPLYYLLVGWPSYIAATWSVYLVRLASVVVNSVFLALAVASAYRWSRSLILLPALAVAVTPTVVFFMGVVNPSGLEMTAGITMWTAAVVLATSQRNRPAPIGLLATLTASVCVEILVRGDSFLWVVACAVVVAPIAAGRVQIGAEARRFAEFVSLPFVAASGIAAAVWMLVGHPLTIVPLGVPAPSTPTSLLAREVFGGSGLLLRQLIGYFGWLDTPAPWITYLLWYGISGALLATALLVGGRRHLVSVALAVAAACVGPFVLALAAFRSSGPLLQGRYFLALVAGVPIVAGSISTQAGLPRRPAVRLAVGILALAAVGQVAAGCWALRRYLVGIDGPLSPLDTVPGVWHPPLPGWLTDVGFVVVWAAVFWLAVRLVLTQGSKTSGQSRDLSLSFLSTRLWCLGKKGNSMVNDQQGRRSDRRRDDRGEGVISAAIAVLVMAFIGVGMWVAFNATFQHASSHVNQQVDCIGQTSTNC